MESHHQISIHDNRLISYEVFCDRREIRFHTEFRDGGEPFEHTTVVFTGVVAYEFKNDSDMGTILFDIEEVPASDIYARQAEQFRVGIRYGWPGSWADSLESATAYFARNGIKGFEVSSSCGLCGWVLARRLELSRST